MSVDRLERHQIVIYLGALLAGSALGLTSRAAAPWAELGIYPFLAALLYATFLQVPFTAIAQGLRDLRFLSATLVLNFVLVPAVVAVMTLWVPLSQAVLLGVLLTLLTPCIDYVIVFTRLAGGAAPRLVAASPLLMLAQIIALPLFLFVFLGPGLVDIVEVGPFLEAFLILIVGPLLLAGLTEITAKRYRAGQQVTAAMHTAMVPLMALTLFVVVASQIPAVSDQLGQIAMVIPIYATFLLLMAAVGWAAVRVFRLDPTTGRALIFSGATRNSLVVLPLALALPAPYAITAAVVVTQTLVELIGMVVYVRVVPKLLPRRVSPTTHDPLGPDH